MFDKEVLAYIVGVAIGDGNLSNPNGRAVRLRVSCDTIYPTLIKNIILSIQTLLPYNSISLVRKKGKRCVDVSCYSNQWPILLGWQPGSKESQQVRIPLWIKTETKYIICCLKGVIETDGSVYTDRQYKTIFFTTTIQPLALDVLEAIINLGFRPHIYTIKPTGGNFNRKIRYNIRLTKDVKRFLNIVQPKKY